ncbi:Immunoglobulin superfamily member 1 [Pteropus alecto]|nr:Immunoglobulin superfamily member 1 [Pteropus alecto]
MTVLQSQLELWIETNYPHTPWENITLWCRSPSQISSKFLLLKDKTQMACICPSYKTFQVSFPIGTLTKSNTGCYRCCYWKEIGWSKPSKVLELEAPGQLPKPIFWIQSEDSPLPRCNVNIFCHGWLQDLIFMLFKEGYAEPVDYQVPTGTVAIFSIADSEGVYICRTHIQMFPSLWSEPSNPLKLIVADTFPKTWLLPQLSPVVQMGQNVSLWYRGSVDEVGFVLYKKGEDKSLQLLDTTNINEDESFFLNNVTYSDADIYSCHYLLSWKTSIRMTSHDTMELVVVGNNSSHLFSGLTREAWLLRTAQGIIMLFIIMALLCCEIIMPTPKPELWAETNFPLAPWKNLTLWCRSPSGSTKEFVLLKDGTGWIATNPASEQVRAAFPLGTLTQSHTGSYHCHSWEEMAVSEPSEALELVGTDILPKPVISAFPPIRGQELQIRCKGWLAGMGFALYKEGLQEPVQQLGAIGREAFFTIQRMEDKDEGNYSCRTHTEKHPFKWSEPSEPLEVVIKEMYPKPYFRIWASPMVTPGARVTFNCSTFHQHMNFILYKDGSEIASSDMSWASPGASAAHFLIISVGFGDGGNYSCRYYDFAIWSEPSDSVELVVTEFYPKPTLLAQPGPVVLPGKNVTLQCQGTFYGMRFALLYEGTPVPLQFQSASGNSADFLLHIAGAEDSGNYSCVYYETAMSNRGSHLSKPIMIWVTDTFPKPWLFAEPSSVVSMGQNVTLWCQGPVHGVGYILHKEREATSMQLWGATSNNGAFFITNISGASIGRYSCCYHPDWTSHIKTQLSNTLELIVTGLLPKPSLLAQPGPMVAPGENMTLQCRGELPDSTFVLLKEGFQEPLELQRPSGYRADFWMPAVRGEDSGIYSCVYYLDSAPFAASNHSDSLEIWVTVKPPKPSLSAWPSTVFKLGKDITLQCRGPLPNVEFVLEHDREEAPQQFSEDGDFVINNVEEKGIGNYSCSYHLQAYPDIWSESSDPLELVGAAGPAAQECTMGNIVQSSLIVVVVVTLGVVLAIEWKKWPRLQTRDSETNGRDQTIALEECNQEKEPGTNSNSPSSISQVTSVELPVPV